MPRKPGPRQDTRSRTWIAQLGEKSKTTGRRGRVMLRHEDGTPVRYEDHAGAHAAFARLMAATEAGERKAAGPTACDVVAAYIRWHEAAGAMPDTIATHTWHLSRFLEFEHGGRPYNDRPAAGFEVADWTRYRKAMQARGLAREAARGREAATGYVRLAFASVHACWRWAARPVEDREPLRLIPENPFAGLIRPRKGRGRKLILPWATIKAMAAFLAVYAERPAEGHRNRKVAMNREREGNRLKALACRLIVECGCRPKEAAILEWGWIREDDRIVEIPEAVVKTHQDRSLAMRQALADELAALRASGRSHPRWAFVPAGDPRTEPMDARKLADWFAGARSAARRSGITLPEGTSLYTFRHSLVTLAREAGMDLARIAPAFGHSAATAEGTYAHMRGTHARSIMDEVWGAIERKAEDDRGGSDAAL